MKKVYVLDDFHPAGVDWLAQRLQVVPFSDTVRQRWHADADGVMVRTCPLAASDFAQAAALKAVVKQGVGMNAIDLDAARAHGIVVANTRGLNSDAVAEMALTLGIAVARRVVQYDRMVRAGEKIERPKLLGMSLRGRTLGIIGMGNIGVRTALNYQAAFDCEVLAYDPFYTPGAEDRWSGVRHERVRDLDDLWPRVDVLSVHVPLSDATRHLVGARELAALKRGAIVLNLARGGIVDESALFEALSSGHVFGAGIDVWDEREPPSPDHPLLSLPNVVALPHVGGGTAETQERISLQVAQELFKILEGGEPLSRVV